MDTFNFVWTRGVSFRDGIGNEPIRSTPAKVGCLLPADHSRIDIDISKRELDPKLLMSLNRCSFETEQNLTQCTSRNLSSNRCYFAPMGKNELQDGHARQARSSFAKSSSKDCHRSMEVRVNVNSVRYRRFSPLTIVHWQPREKPTWSWQTRPVHQF